MMLVFVGSLCDSFDHFIIYIHLINTSSYNWVIGFILNYDTLLLLYSTTLFI